MKKKAKMLDEKKLKFVCVIQMFNDIKKLKISFNIDVKEANTLLLKNNAKTLKDIRVKKKLVYKLWDIVSVVILVILSNCNDWEEITILQQHTEIG